MSVTAPESFTAAQRVPGASIGDTYDEDLQWILGKLTSRANASSGMLFQFLEEETRAFLLARCSLDAKLSDRTCEQIENSVRLRSLDQDPASDTLLQVRTLIVDGDDSPHLRLVQMRFEPTPGVVVVAVVCRPERSGVLLLESIARRLYPVLARYVQLWWLHRTERRRAADLRQALQVADLGVVQLDRRANVIFANACATRLFSQEEGLQVVGRSLFVTQRADTVRLQTAVNHAILRNRIQNESDERAVVMTIERRGRRALLLIIASVHPRAADPHDAAVTIYVLDPERNLAHRTHAACCVYGLTPVEARLVAQLVDGATLQGAADSLNVSLQTVRTYLKQVFQKTTTRRQSELMRLMLATAAPADVGLDLSML